MMMVRKATQNNNYNKRRSSLQSLPRLRSGGVCIARLLLLHCSLLFAHADGSDDYPTASVAANPAAAAAFRPADAASGGQRPDEAIVSKALDGNGRVDADEAGGSYQLRFPGVSSSAVTGISGSVGGGGQHQQPVSGGDALVDSLSAVAGGSQLTNSSLRRNTTSSDHDERKVSHTGSIMSSVEAHHPVGDSGSDAATAADAMTMLAEPGDRNLIARHRRPDGRSKLSTTDNPRMRMNSESSRTRNTLARRTALAKPNSSRPVTQEGQYLNSLLAAVSASSAGRARDGSDNSHSSASGIMRSHSNSEAEQRRVTSASGRRKRNYGNRLRLQGPSIKTSWKKSTWDVCNNSHALASGGLFHGGNAWITFASTESYLPGVFALFGSLKRQRPSFSDEHGEDFVLLVTCGVTDEVALLSELCGLGVRVLRTCDDQQQNDPSKGGEGGSAATPASSASANDHQQPQAAVANRLPKLNIFRVACLYQRIVYVDADMVFLKDPGELMRVRPTVFQAAEGQAAGRFNSGLFVHDCDAGATWEKMEQEIAKLRSCTNASCMYWDRMSKSVDDQGFLNRFFDGSRAPKWRKLGDKPYQYNAKLLFYVMGRVWGVSSKPVALDRSKVVALHWIGSHKPWQIATNYPCGNTKKYCFCRGKERQQYRNMLDVWWDDYQIGKLSGLSYNLDDLKEGRPAARLSMFSPKSNILSEMKTKHSRSKFELCPKANGVWTMPRRLGLKKMVGRTNGVAGS